MQAAMPTTDHYARFLESKAQVGGMAGFDPVWLPEFLFDFQRVLVDWAVRKGRAAIFADCGLGKTPMQLVWAENVVRHTNRPVLILTPLAVAAQTVREAEKFGIDCRRSADGSLPTDPRVIVTNYERLHHFDPADFAGVVCDESSGIKDFAGRRRRVVTEFLRTIRYRLLCTATAAPNDYVELGTSSEALGELGHMDMLAQFFKNDGKTLHLYGTKHGDFTSNRWRFKPHAERDFWRWVCSWARAVRKPGDLGFPDGRFVLPQLITRETVIKARTPRTDVLFDLPAQTLEEQRAERRRTMPERCEKAAELVRHGEPAVCWCHLNGEADLIESLVADARQVSGAHSDEEKEELFTAFAAGQLRVLVTKPKIGALGLNWQHCAHQTFFPSHSFEQFYQGVRRSWRFGQTRAVTVDVISSEGESDVLGNLTRKAAAADRMFTELVLLMNDARALPRYRPHPTRTEAPAWLS